MTSNNSTPESPIQLGRVDRVMDYLTHYRDWFARQSERRYLLTTLGLGAAGLLLIYGLGSLLVWVLGSAFTPDPPVDERPDPLAVAAGQTAEHVITAVRLFATQHPVGTADPGLVAGLWGLAGLVLVVFSGFTRLGVPLFAAWAAATVWTIHTATGENPVAAALAAAGVAVAWCAVRFTARALASLLTH